MPRSAQSQSRRLSVNSLVPAICATSSARHFQPHLRSNPCSRCELRDQRDVLGQEPGTYKTTLNVSDKATGTAQ